MKVAKRHCRTRTGRMQRREEILVAALEEFTANGYEATRLDDVAKRAQIAKGTIFLHFHNKRILFRAVLRAFIRPTFSGFPSFLESFSGTSELLLRDLLSDQYDEIVRNTKARALLRLLIAESGRFPELSQKYYREIVDPGISALRLVLDRGVESGEFQAWGIRNFPQILAAPAILGLVWILVFGESCGLDLDAYREAHLDFVLRGLRSGPPTNVPKNTSLLRDGKSL